MSSNIDAAALLGRAEPLIVGPGDHLAVRFAGPLTPDDCHAIRKHAESFVPTLADRILFLGAEEMAVVRPGERHPSVAGLLRWFTSDHLPERLAAVSSPFRAVALRLVAELNDSPELATALRKLLEAKDCAVRARIESEV